MLNRANRPDGSGLAANVALAVAAALLINALIFLFAPQGPPTRVEPAFAPPGWVIGGVWTLLFALMGAARWLALRSDHPDARRHAAMVALLIAFCAAYPAYTLGLSNLTVGLAGNVATILAAGFVVHRIRDGSRAAAALLIPIVLWVSFATVLVVRVLQLN